MTRDANTAFARAFVDECRRQGVSHAVVAPGSRSTPLALALAGEPRIALHVVLDERAAGFAALGIGRITGRPALVVTTSGTAVANLHPAVLEAYHAGVPLLVCTADRPPELRDVGAPQTVDQVGIFGGAVRWCVDLEAPADRAGVATEWRTVAARAVTSAGGVRPGPVHVNVPFREPLVPTGAPLVEDPVDPGEDPFVSVRAPDPRADPDEVARLADRVRAHPHGVLWLGGGATVPPEVVTGFVDASGWIVGADPGAHGGAAVAAPALEAVLRSGAAPVPTAWLRIGAAPISTTVARWLPTGAGIVVDPAGPWRDPARAAATFVFADGAALLGDVTRALGGAPTDRSWSEAWSTRAEVAVAAQDAALDDWSEPAEPRIARDLVAALPVGTAFVVASSMPVRDVAWFARPRDDIRVVANRGVNGIDGFTATSLGVAWGGDGPVVALTGDLGFLHDGGGLAALGASGADVTVVVVDNDGGGIFSFLPQSELPEHFDTLFGTPPAADVVAIARAHGVPAESLSTVAHLVDAVGASVRAGGPRVLRIATDRARNVEHHRQVWDAVAGALASTAG